MPNHVQNTVTITGPASRVRSLIKAVKGKGDQTFDFSRILPSPKDLTLVHSGSTTIDGVQHNIWCEKSGKNLAIPAQTRERWRQKYGADNWYDWQLSNWGTKWNAYSISQVNDVKHGRVIYIFDTAWSSPDPVIKKLSTMFPELLIDVACGGEVDEPYCYSYRAGVQS